MSIENLPNKKFAFMLISALINQGKMTEKNIKLLTDEEQCKQCFSCSAFPILSEVSAHGDVAAEDCKDKFGRRRYYNEKVFACGRAFVITNHWYGPKLSMPDNRTPFYNWVTAILLTNS